MTDKEVGTVHVLVAQDFLKRKKYVRVDLPELAVDEDGEATPAVYIKPMTVAAMIHFSGFKDDEKMQATAALVADAIVDAAGKQIFESVEQVHDLDVPIFTKLANAVTGEISKLRPVEAAGEGNASSETAAPSVSPIA